MSYEIYKYFKGEKSNPFDAKTQNTTHAFWDYEEKFERKYTAGDFTKDLWNTATSTEAELEEALNPPKKDKLFRLWLEGLIDSLADKYQASPEDILRSYLNPKASD